MEEKEEGTVKSTNTRTNISAQRERQKGKRGKKIRRRRHPGQLAITK